MLNYNYKSCSTVRVGTDVSVMAAFSDCNKRILLLQSENATITLTPSVPTRTVEQDIIFVKH